MRDDRVFRSTRVLGAVIVPFLLVAFALLYFVPDDTGHWFAWDVQPTLTPLVMGAGYVAGACFFWRVAFERRWHRVQVGFLPVFVGLLALEGYMLLQERGGHMGTVAAAP